MCAATLLAGSGCTLVNNLDEYTAGGGDASIDDANVGDAHGDVAVDTAPVACTAAQKSCGGACREKTDDKFGCAATTCDACSFKNAASGGCDDKGACKLGACAPNFGDCNGVADDGCELALDTAVDNCGKCGNHCGGRSNATMACVAGACAIGGCTSGFGDCNKTVDDGCETPTDALPNCGACGNTCAAIAHATADCVASKCVLKTCLSGFVDCDGNPDNGCECGAAGGTATCGTSGDAGTGGTCTFLGCAAGFADCNKNLASDGCEVNLLTDAANCGKCGLSCEGAACSGGICQPTVLAKGQAFPGQLALDRDYVYWTNFGKAAAPTVVGSVASVRKDGTGTLFLIADAQTSSWGIGVTNSTVYWSIYATSSYVGQNDVAATKTWSQLYPTGTGKLTNKLRGVAADGTYVYYANYDGSEIWRITLIGGKADLIADGTMLVGSVPAVAHPNSIVVDGDSVFWTNEGTTSGSGVGANTGSVMRVLRTAAPKTTPTALASARNHPRGLAVNATYVMWSDTGSTSTSTDGAVMRAARADGAAPLALASGLTAPREIAADTSWVYWTEYGAGTVKRAPIAGGAAPVTLATGQASPIGIGVDDKYVFWANFGGGSDGTISRMVKP